MNDFRNEKLRRFINDPGMSEAVFDVVLNVFLKQKPNTFVNEQAASFIAIGQLQEAWKELEKFKQVENGSNQVSKQPGL